MRWRLLAGFGIAGAVTGSALGQFAVDRQPPAAGPNVTQTPAAPALPAAAPMPLSPPVGYAPPVGGLVPAGGVSPGGAAAGSLPTLASITQPGRPMNPPRIEVESALGPNHPWALKPETGPYFICVKAYSRPHRPTSDDPGPSARELAEMLAGQIREIHRVQAFLYEYVSEDRKAEAAALAAERERGQAFLQQLDKIKRQSELQGAIFEEPDNKIRYKTVNFRDQIAVLIGPFQSAETARKAIDEVRKWEAPKQTILMDGTVAAVMTKEKNAEIKNGYINPYKGASVTPNPLTAHATQPASRFDPALIKWNEDNPYSLLRATKSWTIVVKSFNAPVEIVRKDADQSVMKKVTGDNGANALLAAAAQAEKMARMLREMKGPGGQPLALEAFVLHTKHSSLVTVGQFDGPNDPAYTQMQGLLMNMKLAVTKDEHGAMPSTNTPRLFDPQLIPMPIPRP